MLVQDLFMRLRALGPEYTFGAVCKAGVYTVTLNLHAPNEQKLSLSGSNPAELMVDLLNIAEKAKPGQQAWHIQGTADGQVVQDGETSWLLMYRFDEGIASMPVEASKGATPNELGLAIESTLFLAAEQWHTLHGTIAIMRGEYHKGNIHFDLGRLVSAAGW